MKLLNLDFPDIRDYFAEHILGRYTGGSDSLPQTYSLADKISAVHNQEFSLKCTAYSLTHIFEIMNTIDTSAKLIFNPDEQWNNQKETGASDYSGDYLQNALKTLQKKGLRYVDSNNNVKIYTIDGYAQINKTIKDYKEWLYRGYPIYTGAIINDIMDKNCKLKGNLDYNFFNSENQYGHCFCIIGYDDVNKRFICLNSYGKSYANQGMFYLSYSDVNRLFTSYIIYDTKDGKIESKEQGNMQNNMQVMEQDNNNRIIFADVTDKSPYYNEIKKVNDLGLMVGYLDDDKVLFKPNQPITRGEMAVIISRLIDKFNK